MLPLTGTSGVGGMLGTPFPWLGAIFLSGVVTPKFIYPAAILFVSS